MRIRVIVCVAVALITISATACTTGTNSKSAQSGTDISAAPASGTASVPASSQKSAENTSQQSGSKEKVFELYDIVQMNQLKTDLNTLLKVEGKENSDVKNSFTYLNQTTGFGVYVTYNDKDLSTSKTLIYSKSQDLAFLFSKQITKAQADSLEKGMAYSAVKAVLGEEGIERCLTLNPTKDNKVSRMFYWVNKDGSLIQAIFDTDEKLRDATYFD